MGERKLITGNEAVALGALQAGVKVVTGYPGTPSTGALASLLEMDLPGRHVEWSTNEKVAFEIAAGAAWAGQAALCTMKMSGVNVALDSLASVAYSGCLGPLVIYVADDPGVSAGMVEQDSRGFAQMCDLPMLEPATVAEAYTLTHAAFAISRQIGAPVFVRLVAAVANSYAVVEVDEPAPAPDQPVTLRRDITKFTKAGAAICMTQHRDAIARLAAAGRAVQELGLNALTLSARPGGLGIIASGVAAAYLDEGLAALETVGVQREALSVLRLAAVHPCPDAQVEMLMSHCDAILVLEELEPYIERAVYVLAHRLEFRGRIIGKLDGTFSRIGEYGVAQVVRGVSAGLALPADAVRETPAATADEAEKLAAARPITVCAGCPHRGTYMALNAALKKLKYRPDDVMVTGDIGCTILGMNPPFNTVWNEVAMGASIGLAQGYVQAGAATPVIATIGDSTFFHAGIPSLINAVQHQVPLTLIIMDNGWTAMTGMQVNPGTGAAFQAPASQRVDIAAIIPALGVEHFYTIDPYDLPGATETIRHAITLPGVKVVLARRECAIQAGRRGERAGTVTVDAEKCNLCKLCIITTGCAALSIVGDVVAIDPALCFGCGLCAEACKRDAIEYLPAEAPSVQEAA
jgi:indolepyruvate ferredoxin oxidoreductase alpha subunit